MKHWLALAALICFGSIAAQAAVDVQDVFYSSYTTTVVSVSNVTPTALFVGTLDSLGVTTSYTTIMPNRRDLQLQNIDISSNTYISCVVDVSSTIPSGWVAANQVQYGVAPSATVGNHIPSFVTGAKPTDIRLASHVDGVNRYFIPWCLTGGKSSSANLEIIQSF